MIFFVKHYLCIVLFIVHGEAETLTTSVADELISRIAVILIFSFVIGLSALVFFTPLVKIRRFRSNAIVRNGYLELPEETTVQIGVIKIRCYRVPRARGSTVHREKDVKAVKLVTTKRISLNELCNSPFYLYADNFDDIYIEAPGFLVASGRYEGVAGLCFNTQAIPSRVLEISFVESQHEVRGLVELSSSGIKATLTWIPRALTSYRVLYDPKSGVYRVETGVDDKEAVQGTILRVCYKGAKNLTCQPLVKALTPNTKVSGGLSWGLTGQIAFIDTESIDYGCLKRWLSPVMNTAGKTFIFAGYATGLVKVDIGFVKKSKLLPTTKSVKSFDL